MKCPNCQKEISNDSEFCNYCGTHVHVNLVSDFEPAKTSVQKTKKMPTAMILILVFGSIMGVASFFSFHSFEPASTETLYPTEAPLDESLSSYSNEYQSDYDLDDDYLEDNEPTDSFTDIKVTDFIKCPKFTAEKNSSAMVDQIASTAKANIDKFSDFDAERIIKKISNARHEYYDSVNKMEKYMWYGYLLDYKYEDSDPRSELGTDLTQAIKYVYRNVETVSDESTKSNLRQINKDLKRIK